MLTAIGLGMFHCLLFSRNKAHSINLQSLSIIVFTYILMALCYIIGAIYLGKCPVQPNIPIYLIVLGLTTIVILTLSYIMLARGKDFLTGCGAACIYIFSFGWFITGTRWIYAVYPPSYTPGTDGYCHKGLYQFAFILTSLQWAAIIVVLIFGIFYLIAYCLTRNTRYHLMSVYDGSRTDSHCLQNISPIQQL
uniref:Uncharacterized protein n=1 Tax=Gouania willdenowi TaxID=441366 RepID=A0A8C5G1U3_GOUWI